MQNTLIEYCYDFRKLNIKIDYFDRIIMSSKIREWTCKISISSQVPHILVLSENYRSQGAMTPCERCRSHIISFSIYLFLTLGCLKIYLSFRYISASLLPLLCRPNLYSRSLLFFSSIVLFITRATLRPECQWSYGDFVSYRSAQRQSYDRECVIGIEPRTLQK